MRIDDVTIILPASANMESLVDASLVAITEAIAKVAPETVSAGLLGGEFGYGAHYENDVFMMHPFCWCERADCPWCRGCECEHTGSPDFKVTKMCANCADEDDECAPNFRHKASGFEVRWYKWIGRSMEITTPDGVDVRTVLGESLASVPR